MTSFIGNLCLTEPLADAILRESVAEIAQPVEQGTENPRVRSSTLRLGTINFLIMIKGLAIFLAGPFFMDLGDCNGFCNSLEKFSLPLRRLLQVRVRHNVIAVEDRPRLVA